jgi:transcriptional regulator with XRE-family HTH domain
VYAYWADMGGSDQDRTLGERLREARVAKDLTLRELAKRVGRAPSYINDIEYDRRVPSETVLRDICQVLELDFDAMQAAAGRLGEEAERFLKREPVAGVLFRRVQEEGFREKELRALLGEVDRLAQEKRSETSRGQGQP